MASQEPEYCDLVMKGGIASGVVYPQAVLTLARRYRFKNVGGTSAGAIAAAFTAAAALGERRKQLEPDRWAGSGMGMTGLEKVAADLGRDGFVSSLFQPAPKGRALLDLIMALNTRPRIAPWRALWAAIRVLAGLGSFWAPLGLLILLLIAHAAAGFGGVLAALLPIIACTLVVALIAVAVATARLLLDNNFGLCAGYVQADRHSAATPALTDWMDLTLQELAGIEPRGAPLLIRDLWDAPAYPDEPASPRRIVLQTITTDVSHHEPRSLPFETGTFWFERREFARLFPEHVVAWMIRNAGDPEIRRGREYYRFPRAGDLPVLVAARMSLSVPLLLSAVPLHEPVPDKDISRQGIENPAPLPEGARPNVFTSTEALASGGRADDPKGAEMRVCWFSDGGIASNFPIHLFDAPLPRWPTFAINLVYPLTMSRPRPGDAPYLARAEDAGWSDHYAELAAPGVGARAVKGVWDFLFAVIETMQEWHDLLQSRAPGVRDRIVHVFLSDEEGGMNLGMPPPVLKTTARKGAAAGELILADFSFTDHYWVRYRSAVSGLQNYTTAFAVGAGEPISASHGEAEERIRTGYPAEGPFPFNPGQALEAITRLKWIRRAGEYWGDPSVDLTRGTPQPLAHLRLKLSF